MSYQPEIQELREKCTWEIAFQAPHWEGKMAEQYQYAEKATQSSEVLRKAFERVYDMAISYGVLERFGE
jgi:hypothetical protein